MVKNLLRWLPFGIAITAMSGLIYTSSQQLLRQSANDPQIQESEDIATALSTSLPIGSVIPSANVELSRSLSSYVLVFNNEGQYVAGNGKLDGLVPIVPTGVFDYARAHAQDRFTWQPRSGVRQAVVLTWYTGQHPGFVLVGRSLREIEHREDQLLLIIALGWAITMAITFVATLIDKPSQSTTGKKR